MPTTRAGAAAKKKRTPAKRSDKAAQPWLVSSTSELAAEAAEIAEWKARWAATYPGPAAPFAAKVAWAQQPSEDRAASSTTGVSGGEDGGQISTEAGTPQEEEPRTAPPATSLRRKSAKKKKKTGEALQTSSTARYEILAEIVAEAATERVEVCLCVSKEDVAALLTPDHADEATFLAAPERRRCPVFDDDDDVVGNDRDDVIQQQQQPGGDDDQNQRGVLSSLRGFVVAPFSRLWLRLRGGGGPGGLRIARSQKEEPSVLAFAEWLSSADTQAGIAALDAGDDDVVLLAKTTCDKTASADDVLSALLSKLGILACNTVTALDGSLHDQIGQHLAVDEQAEDAENGVKMDRVPFLVQPGPTFLAERHLDALRLLLAAENDSGGATPDQQQQKHTCVLVAKPSPTTTTTPEVEEEVVPKDEKEEGAASPMETTTAQEEEEEEDEAQKHSGVVWLPAFYDAEASRVFAHCHAGRGETAAAKATLEGTDSAAANLKFDLFLAEFKALKARFAAGAASKRGASSAATSPSPAGGHEAKADLPGRLCATLALTKAMVPDVDWLYDEDDDDDEDEDEGEADDEDEEPGPASPEENEDEEEEEDELEDVADDLAEQPDWIADTDYDVELEDLVSKKLAGAWRDLLKNDDAELGLGLEDGDFTPADSRLALESYLENVQEYLGQYDLKFNFRPKKRKSDAAALPSAKKAKRGPRADKADDKAAAPPQDEDDDDDAL